MTSPLRKPSLDAIRVRLIQQRLAAAGPEGAATPRFAATGRTGSGKSALGNLLLGTDLLAATGYVNCTDKAQVVRFPHGLTYIDLPGVGGEEHLENCNRAALGLPQNPDQRVSEFRVVEYDWQQVVGERILPAGPPEPAATAADVILYLIAPHLQLYRDERHYLDDLLKRHGAGRLVYVLNTFRPSAGEQIATPQNVEDILGKLVKWHKAADLDFDPARVVTMDCLTGDNLDGLLDETARVLSQQQSPPIAEVVSYQAEQAPQVYRDETNAAMLRFAAPVADIMPQSDEDGRDRVLAAGQELAEFVASMTEKKDQTTDAQAEELRALASELVQELRHEVADPVPVTEERWTEERRQVPVYGPAEESNVYADRPQRVKVAPRDVGEFFIALGRALTGNEFVVYDEGHEQVVEYVASTRPVIELREERAEPVRTVSRGTGSEARVTYDALGVRGVALMIAAWLTALRSASGAPERAGEMADAYRRGLAALDGVLSSGAGSLTPETLLIHRPDIIPADADRYLESIFALNVGHGPDEAAGRLSVARLGDARDRASAPGGGPVPAAFWDTPHSLVCTSPRNVRAGDTISIKARIAEVGTPNGAALLGTAGMPGGPARLDVLVSAPADCDLISAGKYTVTLPAQGDSDEAVFTARAPVRPGRHLFTVMVIWNHPQLGPFDLARGQVAVQVSAQPTGPVEDVRYPAQLPSAPPSEARLVVRRERLKFHYLLYRKDYSGIDETLVMTANPSGRLKKLTSDLSRMASGVGFRPAGVPDELRAWGQTLWSEFLPGSIREELSRLRAHKDALSVVYHDRALEIPWELMHPVDPIGGVPGFLVELFDLVRVPPLPGARLCTQFSLDQAVIVVPDETVPGAAAEARAISEVLGRGGDAGAFVREKIQLQTELRTQPFGLLHVVAHDAESTGDIGLAAGQSFSCSDLSEFKSTANMWSRPQPLVFINSCRTAASQPSFTQLTSWAHASFEAGAGGFIGSMWDIRSETAGRFAQSFYQAFRGEGQPFGKALHQARQDAKADDDPTWLAYAAYGSHSATAVPD